MFESWRACKRLVIIRRLTANIYDYSSILDCKHQQQSSVNWEVGQWASLLHLGCRGCEFESRPPNNLQILNTRILTANF